MVDSSSIEVRQTAEKGRGVFAKRLIRQDDLIESAEVIVVPADERANLNGTELFNYYFSWGTDGLSAAIALGYGSLYNHSYTPNAVYRKNFSATRIDFVALRDITEGEEITVNYNGNPEEKRGVCFPVAEES